MEHRVPTKDEAAYQTDRNWGRWGKDDQMGAVNLVTPEKRLAAARLVRRPRRLRPAVCSPRARTNNPTPAQHFMKRMPAVKPAAAPPTTTVSPITARPPRISMRCARDSNGMWNGRNPDEVITFDGAQWGSVEHWKEGIITVVCSWTPHRESPLSPWTSPSTAGN